MHDATEGGILGAIWEVADASSKGVHIYKDNILIKEETIHICRVLKIDPYRLISSGSMIITCKDGKELCRILNSNGINASVVGKITDGEKIVISDGSENIIDPPESDEIYKVSIELK